MSVINSKIWRDLAYNKTRSLLVVLSIAIGLFALGLVFGLYGIMHSRMTADHLASVPSEISFWGAGFDANVVDTISREPGIAAAQGETNLNFRWKKIGESDWRDGRLIARADFLDQRMDRLNLVAGAWPDDRTLGIERKTAQYYNLSAGSAIAVEFGRGERQLPITGAVRSPAVYPPQFGGEATFYATRDTVAWLTGFDPFNLLNLRLVGYSEAQADATAKSLENRLERMGFPADGYLITDPNVHPMQQTIDTFFLILLVLGGLSLGLSAFLIINTTNAIIAQQVWQIGIMKVLGATFGRVVRVYLVTALIFGILAVLIAIPSGIYAAHQLAGWLLELMNIDNTSLQFVREGVVIQVLLGLGVPAVAALIPVIGGARISPREAISNYGLGHGFGSSVLDRLIGSIRFLPRPLALSMRNSFRRKFRFFLTLLTLTLSGAIFIMVMSVGSSLNNTLEVLINDLGMDVWVVFNQPYYATTLTDVAKSVSAVQNAEVWDQQSASLSLVSGEERDIYLMGVPPDSEIFHPRLISGRALLPEDGRAILLNSKIAMDEGLNVGDQIKLKVSGQDSDWTVVGLILNVSDNQRDCFVPLQALNQVLGTINRGRIVMVVTGQQAAGAEQTLMRTLRQVYVQNGFHPTFLQSATEVRQQNLSQFNLITYLMLVMSLLVAAVGTIGLAGTMSINVVERGREIGVMRAIGATSFAITGIFVSEGVLFGLLSWLLAVPLSYPGSKLFSDLVGSTLMDIPLDFKFSIEAVLIWLVVIVCLSVLASLWPALHAANVRVRQALAYE